jgi:hypothetical protein
MKQSVNVDDPECPRGSTNCSHTTLSGHVDVLPRNLIAVPRVGFMMAMVQRFRSPFS